MYHLYHVNTKNIEIHGGEITVATTSIHNGVWVGGIKVYSGKDTWRSITATQQRSIIRFCLFGNFWNIYNNSNITYFLPKLQITYDAVMLRCCVAAFKLISISLYFRLWILSSANISNLSIPTKLFAKKFPTFPLSHFGHLGFWKWKDGKVKVQIVNLKLYYYIYYI